MAKKRESKTTETTKQGQEAVKKTLKSEETPTTASKRGRKKVAEVPAVEMGSPITKPSSKAKAESKPTSASRKTEKSVTKSKTKKTSKDSQDISIPIAESDNVTEVIKLKREGRSKTKVINIEQEQEPVYHSDLTVQYGNRLTEFDVHLFKEGRHYNLFEKLGSHPMVQNGRPGTYFGVWAPNAEQVAVMGDFNGWSRDSHQLHVRLDGSGIWEGFIPDVQVGTMYKYHIKSKFHLYHVEKSDPFAFSREVPPQTASLVSDIHYEWNDQDWIDYRKSKQGQPQPFSVYELHIGSWKRKTEDNNRPLTYRELAEELPAYIKDMGYTHVEFMPLMFHPFNGSWGYQITGYFAPVSTYGSPQDLMHLIDVLHQNGIGVIMDWVPSHFPSDEHGLSYFDGTHLFEHADPRKGFHPDWNSYIFNYGRNEVRSFLISNALFWLDKYHIDGLRVDAVASMLYLDYSRKEGEWIPNEHGGRENLEAISFLKEFNSAVHDNFPEVQTIAEESTAWPAVTGSIDNGGLGFNMKWMMGWMHDTLHYFSIDPVYRRHHQGDITFSIIYAFSERFMLPLSHDEVVHGKGALLRKMPGDEWQQFANLRALYAYMYAHPGAKLMFMGCEFGQTSEWNHDSSLDWHLLQYGYHHGLQEELKALNTIYKNEPAMYEHSFEHLGFEWIDYNDAHNSVISFLRKGNNPREDLLVICNFTPIGHEYYRLGVPQEGEWVQMFNSDDQRYGGSNVHNENPIRTIPEAFHGRDHSLTIKVPPLAVVYFKLKY